MHSVEQTVISSHYDSRLHFPVVTQSVETLYSIGDSTCITMYFSRLHTLRRGSLKEATIYLIQQAYTQKGAVYHIASVEPCSQVNI